MATSDAPISIGSVTLIVNDLAKVSDFYRSMVGLELLSLEADRCTLGQGNRTLIKLEENKQARRYPGEAGLFHTAFLLPDRSALAEWYQFAKARRVQLDGMADHGVSEAIYLNDPEGNGIEIYADKDRSEWPTAGNGELDISTTRLRTNDLLQTAQQTWTGAPDGTVVGHVHLQVGQLALADEFFIDQLKFEQMSAMDSASFYGSGGYHHHIAGNIWNSRGANKRPSNATGLSEVELCVTQNAPMLDNAVDPWGTQFVVTPTD